MKKLLVLLCFILVKISSGKAQTSHPYLWEVTGGDLKESSYLLGSMHLNDARLFNFSDSMFLALSSSKQFATEMDFDLMDTLVTIMLDELFEEEINGSDDEDGEENEEESEELSNSSDDPFAETDINGKATVMDPYLYKISRKLGLESYGLEPIDDYVGLDGFAFDKDDAELLFGSDDYEKWIAYYLSNDMELLGTVMTLKDLEAYDMLNRNVTQANSFEKLALKDKTFAVVGLGHLVGDKSVLELLEKKGYKIRRVEASNNATEFDEVFESPSDDRMFTISNDELRVELQSNIDNEILSFQGLGGMHLSMDMEEGLMFMSLMNFAPSETIEKSIANVQMQFFPKSSELKVIDQKSNDDLEIIQLELSNNEFPSLVTIHKGENVEVVQLVYGYSRKSMKSPKVANYLNGFKRTEIVEAEFDLQKSDQYDFQYLFPDEIEFISKEYTHETFKENGNANYSYKTFTNLKGSEYLVQVVGNPPGLLYTNPYVMQEDYLKRLSTRFDASLLDSRLDTIDNCLVRYAHMVDVDKVDIYTKVIIRGSFLYVAIQFDNEGKRNDAFFDGMKLLKSKLDQSEKLEFPAAQFSMAAPSEGFKSMTYEDGDTVTSYALNYPGSGVVLDLEFTKIGAYEQRNLADSVFSYANMVNEEHVDSFLNYELIKYRDVCPGYLLQYTQDSTHLLTTEILYYCNKHTISMSINGPLDMYDGEYLENIMTSVEMDLNAQSSDYFTSRKAPKIIRDLSSKDSVTFYKAKTAFEDYPLFKDDDVPSIFSLLDKKNLDQDEEFNLNYSIVFALHDFYNPEVIDKIINHYPREKNANTKSLILESLAGREGTKQTTDGLVKLLSSSTPRDLYPEDLYARFRDSTEFFERHYQNLKSIASKDIAKDQFLGLFQYYMNSNPSPVFVYNDQPWMAEQVKQRVAIYKEESAKDTTATLPVFVMDYMKSPLDTVFRNELYGFLEQQKDPWVKYRVQVNKLSEGKEPNLKIVQALLDHSYYGYWILKAYDEQERKLPVDIIDNKGMAKVIMRNQCYERYEADCDTCEVVKELTKNDVKIGESYFLKCTGSEIDGYYFGCVGSFLEEGKYNFNNPQSAYFSSPREESAADELLLKLIEHINAQ